MSAQDDQRFRLSLRLTARDGSDAALAQLLGDRALKLGAAALPATVTPSVFV